LAIFLTEPAVKPDEIWGYVSPRGILRVRGEMFRVAIGAVGIVAEKNEGDMGTPIGAHRLRRVYYRADRIAKPVSIVPVEVLSPEDGWCDDSADSAYNRFVRLPYPGRHESLWRQDGVYDLIGVLGWNDQPPVAGRGSAIFLHVAREDFAPTEGCVAMALAELRHVLTLGLAGVVVEGC
jgi:L,D-peptidoglycan transpeptidase YkuD (ErfK/YbiS/YcfS/YnhG family)